MNFIFFAVLLFFLGVPIDEAAPELRYTYCEDSPTFTPNSTFQSNLDLLLSSLTANATVESGFLNFTSGDVEIIYGIFLCRADVPPASCQECSATAERELKRNCATRKVAVTFYDACMLRYSNESIFSTLTESPRIILFNTANVSDPVRFNQFVSDTMKRLALEAANAPTVKKFAAEEANFTSTMTLYSFAQCTPDLTVLACDSCINRVLAVLQTYSIGGNVLSPSCNIRYELFPFYNVAV